MFNVSVGQYSSNLLCVPVEYSTRLGEVLRRRASLPRQLAALAVVPGDVFPATVCQEEGSLQGCQVRGRPGVEAEPELGDLPQAVGVLGQELQGPQVQRGAQPGVVPTACKVGICWMKVFWTASVLGNFYSL